MPHVWTLRRRRERLSHALQQFGDRPHRASGDLALHVLEVMEAFDTASKTEKIVDIKTTVERPAPLAENIKDGKIAA